MVADVVVERDDIDMMQARIEMARDKLTKRRITRATPVEKGQLLLMFLSRRSFGQRVNSPQDRAAKPGTAAESVKKARGAVTGNPVGG